MSVDDLVQILPKLGDRIALKLFERKTKLIQSLCAKLGILKTIHCHDTAPAEFQVKHISESSLKWRKRTMARHLELGWIHNEKQVRTAKGGGTRKIELPRNSSIVDFIFKLTDFSNREIQNETIEELYESSKVSLLRLYMVTEKKRFTPIQITCPLDIAVPVHLQSKEEFSFESVLKVTPSQSQPVAESIFESVETLSTPSRALQLARFANMYANCTQNAIMPSVLLDSMLDQHSSDNEILFHSGDNHFNTTSELDDTVPLNESVKKVKVKRGRVFDDMMNYFLDANFDPRLNQLQVELVSERGEDAGGVSRDVVSEFWETFYIKHTVGSDIKIPTTVHIMRREHWEAVAKVLMCGYEQEGYLPIQLSEVFLQRCIDGKDVQDEQLLNTFLSSLPTMDREIFEMALIDFDSVDEEDLYDVFSSYEARIMPTKDNIRKLVRDISHHQIVQKPSFVTECWSPLLQCYLRPLLPNTGLEEVYRDLHVTKKKPIAHTCGCVLELSTSYDKFLLHCEHFDNILDSKMLRMDII
ncbi:hypothetical protein ACJMK2_025781 [Sinanodonta woodiana]|uniref:HECT domain-containing protein n=1 Tax=Sinanodonta woodiana TaxID=1069815 RepID=A0ABD3XJX4_SINWO